MSTNSTTSSPSAGGSGAIPPFALPIIEAFAREIRPAIAFIMIGTVFTTILLSLLVALFFLSDAPLRKRPVFIFNAGALVLGIVVGILNNHLEIHAILSPLDGDSNVENLVYNILFLWLPWLSEAVLILRIVAVFGSNKARLVPVLIFPIVLKCLRASLIIFYLQRWWLISSATGPSNPVALTRLTQSWTPKVLSITEMLDNGYASAVFLFQLRSQSSVHRNGHISTGNSGKCKDFYLKPRRSLTLEAYTDSFRNKVRILFWIATTNFVVPAHSTVQTNAFTTTAFTVLATVWSSSVSFKEARDTNMNASGVVSEMRFTSGQSKTTTTATMASSGGGGMVSFMSTMRSSLETRHGSGDEKEGFVGQWPVQEVPMRPLRALSTNNSAA
ncbi:hypothetical protein PUNSTDRAFT_47283 [Punctularia strigosozonata HHB-11173 SS5]|uniref:Uncharacterized protein n=1 Tax=Punctularia strigosozonata (strain HHB-11173) TaxID=741275 RepID=R7S5D9_PUNST|nr:uncharacterized protein PUNSTDRAFT_47283 [Punctularia strigosozonata HHB-11173 SS5]EIN04601.1 hypothetical protein PUNSTDRAFT_47283 [Punctularia strigosozonata HHB-11173 SS5]